MEELGMQEEVAQASSSLGASNKLFLGGLSWVTTEETIRQHFQKYGEITEVIVMRDRITNKPRGFGFITFKEQSSADEAYKDAHTLDGRTIDAKPSLPHGEHSSPKSKKIFVGGLAPETSEEAFKQHFERFGKVLEGQIMVDHTSGRSRGFGFITFEDEASVASVFNAGSMQELGGKKVEVKTATPKGSGPIGRGPAGMAATAALGRGITLPAGASRGIMPGRFGEFAYGIGPAGYPMPAGYMPVPGYGGYLPYGAFPGMMLGGYSGYPYAGAPYGFAGPMGGFTGSALQQQQQQQRTAGTSGVQQQQQRRQQVPQVPQLQKTAGQYTQQPPGRRQQQRQPSEGEAEGQQPVDQQQQQAARSEAAAAAQQLAQLQLQQQGGLLPSAGSLLPGHQDPPPAGSSS